MANNPIEQDVILDADGRPLYAALTYVQNEIEKIRRAVDNIRRDSYKSADDFGKVVAARARELQTLSRQARALSASANVPGANISDLNAERRLGRATRDATLYARELGVARNAAEALDAKIASINRRMAERGRNGNFATLTQTNNLAKLEQAARALRDLDRQFERLQLKTRNTPGDFTGQIRDVMAAREALNRAAANPRRVNLGPEVLAVNDAQVRMAEAIALARSREAQYTRDALRARKESAQAEASQMRNLQVLETARVANATRLNALRTQLKTATADERRELLMAVDVEKARGQQIRQNIREMRQMEAEQARSNARTPLQNILSPGYAAAAFARTSIYGAAAMAAYGAFNTVQDSLANVVRLEDELRQLQAIADATDTEMQALKGSIFDVGSTSRFSVVELTQISQTLAQAGVSASQMREVLESVVTLATASGSTPDEAVQLVTSALGAFQLQAGEAARVADLMTTALNRTKLTVQQTALALQYVGSTAYEQNITLEQLLATTAAIAQAGVRSGSTIGTGMRQFLVDLQNPSEDLTEQLQLLNLTSRDVDVATRGLPAVLETLRDAGFGAAQAYQGLEVRAAAWYLVAKNNIDIMDQLQLSFAYGGAAATANERAMNSLTAQWQRFKNVITEDFAEALETPIGTLRDLLRSLSDRLEEMDRASAALAERRRNGTEAWYEYDFGPILEGGLERFLNGQFMPYSEGQGLFGTLGTDLRNLGRDANDASGQMDRLQAATADAGGAVDETNQKVVAIGREIHRLLVQQESLEGQTVRVAAETNSLSSRFEGLSRYLINSTGDVRGLITALQDLRAAEMQTLQGQLITQGSSLRQQNRGNLTNVRAAVQGVAGNQQLWGLLTPAERSAISAPSQGNNLSIINDAARRIGRSNPEFGPAMDRLVNVLGNTLSTIQQIRTNQLQQDDVLAQQTPVMQNLSRSMDSVNAIIQQISSASGEERTRLVTEANRLLNTASNLVNNRLAADIQPGSRRALESVQGDIASARRQLTAGTAETADERRARERREREAARGPLVSRQNVIDIVREIVPNATVGSGYRSQAQQDSLVARGATRARVSDHTTGIGQDFPIPGMSQEEGDRLATRIRNRLKESGIEAQVLYERGGPGRGTGSHIHVGVRTGARLRNASGTGTVRDDISNERLALNNLNDQLKDEIEQMNQATSEEVFNQALQAARVSLATWSTSLRSISEDEIAARGMTANQAADRRREVENQIQQRIDEFNQSLARGIVKNVQRQFEAVERQFQLLEQPGLVRLSNYQGQVQGLGLPSMSNRVPDYVQALAERRVADQQEANLRLRASALPGMISANEASISAARQQLSGSNLTPAEMEATNQELERLILQVAELRREKEQLDAAFGAEGLIPTSFNESLRQAVQAFYLANGAARGFREELMFNLGGAITSLQGGIQNFFYSIETGSASVLQAFGNFARGILDYMSQIASRALANQLLGLFFDAIGAGVGGGTSLPFSSGGAGSNGAWFGGFTGNILGGAYSGGLVSNGRNPIIPSWEMIRRGGWEHDSRNFNTGGYVSNGDTSQDSVKAKLARGEFVMRKRAVDSVGPRFMAQLNQFGAKALQGAAQMPQLEIKPHQEVKVYVIPPEAKPQLTKDDILVTLQDDMLNNGQTAKLIKYVAKDN